MNPISITSIALFVAQSIVDYGIKYKKRNNVVFHFSLFL